MKKVLLVLALVAVYGVSMAMSGSNVVSVAYAQSTVIADIYDNNFAAPDNDKEKEKATTKDAKAVKSEAKSEGCAAAKGEGCSTAKSEGCGDKAKTASVEKKEGGK